MDKKLQIKIDEEREKRYPPICSVDVSTTLIVIDDNGVRHELGADIWLKLFYGLFVELVEGDVPDDVWGSSYWVSYLWVDKEKIRIKFSKDDKTICETTVRFVDFAEAVIKFFDDVIKLYDEINIQLGYTDQNDWERKLILAYRSGIIEKVEEWKKRKQGSEVK